MHAYVAMMGEMAQQKKPEIGCSWLILVWIGGARNCMCGHIWHHGLAPGSGGYAGGLVQLAATHATSIWSLAGVK